MWEKFSTEGGSFAHVYPQCVGKRIQKITSHVEYMLISCVLVVKFGLPDDGCV